MVMSIYQSDSHLWDVIDLDTGKRIEKVQWANDETGNYGVLKSNEKDEIEWCDCPKCGDSHTIMEKKHGNIKLVRKSKE